jgi:hypothetical protein
MASLPQAARGLAASCAAVTGEARTARRTRARVLPLAAAAPTDCALRAACRRPASGAKAAAALKLPRVEHLGTRLAHRARARALAHAHSRTGVVGALRAQRLLASELGVVF